MFVNRNYLLLVAGVLLIGAGLLYLDAPSQGAAEKMRYLGWEWKPRPPNPTKQLKPS